MQENMLEIEDRFIWWESISLQKKGLLMIGKLNKKALSCYYLKHSMKELFSF